MTWQLRDFCTDPRVDKMQLYGADASHRPLTHPDPRSGHICQWHAANTHMALGEKRKGNPEILALTPFLTAQPYHPAMALCPAPSPAPLA